MTLIEIPTLTTSRLRLRAFQASDLDAYAAMQADPEVMRYLVTGRTSTATEVWPTMASSLGGWALRGYGMCACEKIDGGTFIGSVGTFQPLDWPEPEISYSLDRPFGDRVSRPKRRGPLAIGCSSTFLCRVPRASFGTITHPSALWNGLARFTNTHSNCAVLAMNTGCITARNWRDDLRKRRGEDQADLDALGGEVHCKPCLAHTRELSG